MTRRTTTLLRRSQKSFFLRAENSSTVANVNLLLDTGADTGADTTLLPRHAVVQLGITLDPELQYELIGFDGNRSTTQAVDLDTIFLNKAFRGRYLLCENTRSVLGRDVMARVVLPFDGPTRAWTHSFPSI